MKTQRHPLLWLSIGFIILICLGGIGYWFLNLPNAAINQYGTPLSNVIPDDFRIAGISLGYSRDQVKRCLGAPLRQRSEKAPSFQNPIYIAYQTRWFYRGLEIWFLASAAKNSPPPSDGQVIKIIVSKPGYRTRRGIGIGDSTKDVIRQYGRAPISNAGINFYSDQGDISFSVKDFNVSRIEIEAKID